MKNIAAWLRNISPFRLRQTGGQTGSRLVLFSDVTSDGLWLTTDEGLQKKGSRKWKKERKREREAPLSVPPPSAALGGFWTGEQRGGRVVVTAYCLSSVCCGPSLSTHSSKPSYLYPLHIQAGGGRLQSFSSLLTLWRASLLWGGLPVTVETWSDAASRMWFLSFAWFYFI